MTRSQRVAAINDLSGFGRCSLTVAIPIISTFGFQVCPLPTAVLSAHTGIEGFSFRDLTKDMQSFSAHWKDLKLNFDCIYSGFLGSHSQIDIVKNFMCNFGTGSIKLVDPVMADNGIIYKTYTEQMCSEMRELVRYADIITPNLTEAAILLGESYPESRFSYDKACHWLSRLIALGPTKAVITGIITDKVISNVGYDRDTDNFFMHSDALIESCYCGSGDIFSSCLAGYLLSGKSFEEAVILSGEFIKSCTEYSLKCGIPQQDGLLFEPFLKNLI